MSSAPESGVTPLKIGNDPVPLRIAEGGSLRVGNTRVTLEVVIEAFYQGSTPEEIVAMFPGLELADVYAVISYYLRRKREIDEYWCQQDKSVEELRWQHPEIFDNREIRKRILARRLQERQVIQKLKKRLHDHLGEALERVIIFGSVARGSATEASDIDVMMILNDEFIDVNWRTEEDIMAVIYPIELEDDVVFDLKIMGKNDLQGIRGHTPFIENVMKEGITV